ncbi:PIR Superfamily Protein [Plasmodium ovale curtisi]|uniref:PIR Superfamily Protein n=1 Tax=Plasmodium ovale curtisi TaxID=864141 RepID=A0A1A8VTD7_PLAOA|nr:PIR Superfamily Protein [Plasmodium ovale curtisi]
MTMTKDENYELCDEFPYYIKLEESIISGIDKSGKFNEECALIEQDYSGEFSNCKDVCAKFKHIATLFLNETESDNSEFINVFFFLNFWLNYQLMNISESIVSARQFYDNLKIKDSGFDSAHKLNDKIRVIEKEQLKNMAMLYKLYKNYNGINDTIKSTSESEKNCLEHTEQCTLIFEEANRMCSADNKNFCRALESFKGKYEYMFKDITYENCKLHKPLPLVAYIDPSRHGTEIEDDYDLSEISNMGSGNQGISAHLKSIIVVIFTLLSFFLIFLILYKATPFGIYFRSQIKRLKKKLANIEYDNERKSIHQITEYKPLKGKSNELCIPYYYGGNS